MKVGHNIEVAPGRWTFGGNVADTFVEHVRRSVPFYDAGHDLVCQFSDFFCRDDSVCYEIGVSTGELIGKLARHHAAKPGIRWIGIDPVEAMIEKARRHCSEMENVDVEVGDACSYAFDKADLVVSYYTIQFVPPRDRQRLIDRLYERLNWGGALLLFEKVRAPDARFQDMTVALYNDYKRREGFTADEILNKTASLKSILEPFSTEGNLGLLRRAGFVDVTTVMKYLCFEGFLAIK